MTPAKAVVGILATLGPAHFLAPRFFDAMIPPQLPGTARQWTYGSGIAELAVAAAVAHPRTRRHGALAATALFVGVFPGNVQMALDAKSPLMKAVAYGRLPLQVPLVALGVRAARDAR